MIYEATMQFYNYLQYFFYLANNWDFRIATHILSNEMRGEKKYRIRTTGADELGSLEEKGIDISHATIYMPASYDLMEEVFEHLPLKTYEHFLDIGCGKGRVLCVAANKGITKITGLELSKELCDIAKLNLLKTKQRFPALNYHVINNDAFYFDIPDDGDCIFMFNPFDEIIMSSVVENIAASLERNPRQMTIIYFNPMYKHLFTEQGFRQVASYKKLTYMEATVLIKNPG
jgi:SAM-dependent methyltransferase